MNPLINEKGLGYVFNKREWLSLGWFTEAEIDSADSKGFIGTKHGADCYVATLIPTTLKADK